MKKNDLKYKICILAAGAGSKMDYLSKNIHKSILPINFKAVISYIVEKFPKDIEMVIAIGYKKDTVKDYLALAYPNRKFTFVEVDKYSGLNTGPGYSLLKCKKYLGLPFIFFTADTIVLEDIPKPDHNWLGIAPVKNTEQYCTVKINNNLVYQLDVKVKNNNRFAFIGVAGIHDYDLFFKTLRRNQKIVKKELQVINGLEGLIKTGLVPIGFTWFDTGTYENYIHTNKHFSGENKFNFSKGKGDEYLYFVDEKVIKFFADKKSVANRCLRANQYLKDLSPEIVGQKGNYYSYNKVGGQVLYEALDRKTVIDFLSWAKVKLWKKIKLTEKDKGKFAHACKEFYITKTNKRIKSFYDKTGIEDKPVYINGILTPTLKELLGKVNWGAIVCGTPSNFHGDLQFDNILITKNSNIGHGKFLLLDWRQDFNGLLSYGDLYYDLAKLYGGTLISYQLIKKAMFSFEIKNDKTDIVRYDYYIKNDLNEAREEFDLFLKKNSFDIMKVKTLTAIIFLNMSPLHEAPFDRMLYFMGKSMLYKLQSE